MKKKVIILFLCLSFLLGSSVAFAEGTMPEPKSVWPSAEM